MKKLMIAAAASVAAMSGAAQAADWNTQTYGQDFQAWWLLNAPVDVFCALNSAPGATSGVNAVVTPGDNGQGGTVAEADGTITFDIDRDATNTMNFIMTAEVNFPYSQCNTHWSLKLDSANGGLKNPVTTTDTDFVQGALPYLVNVNFDGRIGARFVDNPGETPFVFLQNVQPTAGNFMFRVSVPPKPNKLLVEGAYSDFLKIILAPSV